MTADPHRSDPHASDDAPTRAPRKPREGGIIPLDRPTNVVAIAGMLGRLKTTTACQRCGKGLDLTRIADPRDHPLVEGKRGGLLFTFFCPEGHAGQVSSADFIRAMRADRTGKTPVYLAALDETLRVVAYSLRRAHRSRDFETVSSLAEKVARIVAMNLRMGGVLADRVEVEHSGTVTVDDTGDRVAAAARRVEELKVRHGIGRVIDAETVEHGPGA